MFSAINQIIKGHSYDYSSIEASINGTTVFTSFQEINYDWEASIGVLRGTGSAMKKARTRGEFDFTGSIILAKSDASELETILAALGMGGFGEASFDLTVTYSEFGQVGVNKDVLVGCRLISGSNSHSRSPDPLVVSYDLDIMDILYNGKSPCSPAGGGGGIAGAIGGLLP
jgi:hypothetical protein